MSESKKEAVEEKPLTINALLVMWLFLPEWLRLTILILWLILAVGLSLGTITLLDYLLP